MARVVFMGTPSFAVPSLLALDGAHQVVGVVTQPDRAAGRGRQPLASAVKKAALERHLPVFQPATLRQPEALLRLAEWQPEVIVVAAFGQILRADVLGLPRHGCLNVHASLLPRHRGAAPIPAAILAGDLRIGVTLMRMDEGLDTGPILAQAECPIEPSDTTGSLTARLAELGAQLLIRELPAWLGGRLAACPQDPTLATFCKPLAKEDGRLDWTRPAVSLDRQVRAYEPWPGAYTVWDAKRVKVRRARPASLTVAAAKPGTVVQLLPTGLGVATGEGVLELLELQLEGRKPMPAHVFALGQRGLTGSLLGV